MHRPRFAVLAVATLFIAACGGDSGAAGSGPDDMDVPEAERYGGTAVVAHLSDVPDVNPLTSSDQISDNLEQFVLFTPVVAYDEKLQPIPALARSWEVNDDTTELTFHLRDDVYWHDGPKTTAYDLKFAYDMARNPTTGYPNLTFFRNYGEGTAVDSFTFRVKMKPHAEYMDLWRRFYAVPQHLLGDVPAAEMRMQPYNSRNPVGNGPFKFVEHVPQQSWTFAANERYPQELGGRPYVDRLVYRVIPEATTRLTELLSGDVDYYINPPPEQSERIKASPNVRLLSFPDRSFTILAWNERREPFDDVRVRRALTMAIDRQAIVEGVNYGYGQIGNSTVPPFYWQYDPSAGTDLSYDPAAAKQLLAEAGWTDRDGNGVLENAQGKEFRFTLKTNQGNALRADVAEVVQADLREVGVVAQPQIVEWGALLDALQTPSVRDFDAVLIGWVTEFKIDDSDLFACDRRDRPFQWVGYCNPQTDRLLDTLQTITDRAAAKPVWARYQQTIAHDQPYTVLFFDERLEGVKDRLRNVHPDARGDWVGVKDWYILPSARRGGA